ncbi:MAG: LuxR C-terminal-related transcriptional regulator [Verrucomicrobiales bacterium]|nr:LuxR C-terminal-related transcriptional regulator [Verrucomicrobiales bacterium]
MLATEPASLLQTKLHPPRVAHGPILRQHLFDLLDRAENDTVTLVSAPPGYGKSVLLATWLKERDLSFGWLSLDEGDNEFGVFLQYLLAAVQKQHPEACHRLSALLNSVYLSDAAHLARQFSEALVSCGEEVLLVLDDYHRIRNKQVQEFLSTLIENPPPLLRLILLTRRDPPLPLNILRSQGQLSEIRMRDLRFKTQEVEAFLAPDVGGNLSEKTLKNLDERIEGWAAGLRLVTLNLRYSKDPDKFLGDLNGSPQVVREYLMNEVLAKQPSPFRECLLKVAVLDRFCASLCKNLCLSVSPELQSYCEEGAGEDDFPLMGKLLESNLFMISLDDEGTWYRFHHLFQDFLLERLLSEMGESFIDELHSQAAKWFEGEGLLEEAVAHALKSKAPVQAVEIVKSNLQPLFQHEKEVRLVHLIHQLPVERVAQEPELLLLQAWTKLELLELGEGGILEQIDELIAEMPSDSERVRRIRGSLHVMRCVQYYECTDTATAREHAESALGLLAADQWIEQGTLMIMQALLLQMEGLVNEAKALIFSAFEDKSLLETTFHTRLVAALCFIHWLEADLQGMLPFALELEQLGNKLDFAETISHALYFKAVVHYERNEIDEAEDPLTVIVEEYADVNFINTMHSTFALALVYEAQGRNDEAGILVKDILQRTLEIRSASLYATSEAVRAEINIRLGKVAEAAVWARAFKQSPRRANYRFFVPHITMLRVLLAEGGDDSREDAMQLVLQLEDIYTQCHNRRFLIHVLALKALCLLRMQQQDLALESLHRAVILAQPGGFIKLFLDTGSELIPLFNRLKLDVEGLEYVGRILAGFTTEDGGGARKKFMPSGGAPLGLEDPLIDELTDRELEVLFTLASRLSNREIGEKLFIAPGTVKRHTNTIYRKLNVHGRRDAVAKARGLGLLPTD